MSVYMIDDTVYATDIDSKTTRVIVKRADLRRASGFAVNADETPKSQVFWLVGCDLATGTMIKYKIEREVWSVHYNVSAEGKVFAGDGGGPRSVAAPGNGQWIYLFTPNKGVLKVERLVDLSKHDYRLEPNVSFTPDGKWIVFRSNMHGASHVYAVEVKRANG